MFYLIKIARMVTNLKNVGIFICNEFQEANEKQFVVTPILLP